MDPLSILGAVSTAIETTYKISSTLFNFIQSTRVIDKTLDELNREVEGLTKALETIELSLKDRAISRIKSREDGKGPWGSLDIAVTDTQRTVNALKRIVEGHGMVNKSANPVKKAVKQVKLNLDADQISKVKDRIHTHTTSLQLALQTASLLISCQSSEGIQTVERLLRAMHLNVESSRKNATDERLPTRFRNPELLKHTEQLISSANTVLSSRSTAWGGSEMQFPHTDFNLEEVQSTDSDSDDDYDIAKKCFERGKKDFSSDQHAKALESFRAGLKRVEKLGLKKKARLELRTIQLRMGFSLLSLGELGESEQRLLSVARAQTKDDKGARLALHASSGLAQMFLCKRVFAKADEWCSKSRIGWKRIAGKEHPAYITCLRLSAFSSELNGNYAEAAAIEEMANDLKAAPAAVDTGLGAYESLGFTIEKSRILVTEYHKKVPDTTRKEASTKSRRFSPGRQPGTDPINGPKVQTLAESPIIPKSGTTAVGSLHDAARKADTDLIKRLFQDGADIEEAAGGDLERPLYLAAMHGNTSAVKCLLDRGANIEAKNKSGYTALIAAAWKGHKSIVECLLDCGANVEAKQKLDYTALLEAARKGHKSIVEYLLDRGADIEAKTISGETALLQAARKGHESTVECLIARGANIKAKQKDGYTALLDAAEEGHKSIVEYLLDLGANIEAKNKSGNTALLRAAGEGHESTVECLVARGANIEAKNKHGDTALLWAAWKGHKSIVEYLLDRGANIEAANSSGKRALLIACRSVSEEQNKLEFVQTIELLCSRGADVSVKDDKGNSLLGYARKVENSKIREELISVSKKYGAKE